MCTCMRLEWSSKRVEDLASFPGLLASFSSHKTRLWEEQGKCKVRNIIGILSQPGQGPKFCNCPSHSGTVGNYVPTPNHFTCILDSTKRLGRFALASAYLCRTGLSALMVLHKEENPCTRATYALPLSPITVPQWEIFAPHPTHMYKRVHQLTVNLVPQ